MTIAIVNVTATPKVFFRMLAGVPSRERAQAWAERNGYTAPAYLIQWHKRLERVYVIRVTQETK